MSKIKTALISVSDKSGLVELGAALNSFGIKILSTGGSDFDGLAYAHAAASSTAGDYDESQEEDGGTEEPFGELGDEDLDPPAYSESEYDDEDDF